MDNIKDSTEPREPQAVESSEIEPRNVSSVALARLIEEVQNSGDGKFVSPTAYNRTYNRHNR